MAPQTVARLERMQHASGNGTISDNVYVAVARQGYGAAVARKATDRVCSASVYEGFPRAKTPITTTGSLNCITICGAANTLAFVSQLINSL